MALITKRPHRAGILRFCGVSCRDGYLTDVRYGLAVSPRTARRTGYVNMTGRCDYCRAFVPPNAAARPVHRDRVAS